MTLNNTSTNTIQEIFQLQKASRIKLAETTADQRKEKLNKLLKTILNSQDEICEAVYKDLHKSKEETKLTEIFSVTSEIKFVKRNLSKWIRPKRVSTPIALFGASSKIIYESIGQSLIISPWNYPFQLATGPLVSAIAAGNAVMIKPSEKSPNTSALLERMLNNLFHKDEVRVFLGDAKVARELTSLPFNHIFFTGNPEIGKLVMGAASKNLTKVTLELGGKSPSIINKDADIKTSAQKNCLGKISKCRTNLYCPGLFNRSQFD
ncbi:MAG: aldehyde dehydrogenase family protein [Melioribacteraceae bacterium]|nr:aldehyde dehydrogenase family protein [Melioribacteraceae bacterium]